MNKRAVPGKQYPLKEVYQEAITKGRSAVKDKG
jgi:hypothetical protein